VKPQQKPTATPENVKLTQCEYSKLFLSPGIVSWLQTFLHWWDNNTVFIVDFSRVYANSTSEYRQETKSKHTHTLHF